MQPLLTSINALAAPQPIGPYSQAIAAGDYVFCSGQIALDAATGEFVNGSVEQETTQVLDNLRHVLQEAGLSYAHIVKTTIFLTDLGDFAKVNAIYEEMLGSARPARSTVEVSKLPRGARVEIECIAYRGSSRA